MRININNKMKQYFGGNWGKPDKCEQLKNSIPKGYFDDKAPKSRSKKKKNKTKKKYIYDNDKCPFCDNELEDLPIPEEDKKKWYYRIFKNKAKKCKVCGSKSVSDCPGCHRETWYNPETQIYKHQNLGCGFEGKRLIRKSNNDS